jgi:hypothetical protein
MARLSFAFVVVGTLALAGCGSDPGSRGVSGAAIGAGTGAIAGAIFGGLGAGPGALIGAGVGGVAGLATTSDQINLGRPMWQSR